MAVLFAVFLNEKMMKTKTETNKQTKSDTSTSERQPSANGCQHLTHAQSYFSETGACGLLFLSLLGLLSINQAAEQKKKTTTTTNKQTKQNQQQQQLKETHQELVFQCPFFPSSSSPSLRSSLKAHFMRNALTLQTKPLP